jgi:hypothetical protein
MLICTPTPSLLATDRPAVLLEIRGISVQLAETNRLFQSSKTQTAQQIVLSRSFDTRQCQ